MFATGEADEDEVEPQLLFDPAGPNVLPLAESLAQIAENTSALCLRLATDLVGSLNLNREVFQRG